MSDTIQWQGKQAFYVAGTKHDDCIRIDGPDRKSEVRLTLTLPTLAITYADMRFANAIGGAQADYPDSAIYGAAHFDPPVVINGEPEVERLTWIRGADRVVIGRETTSVEWWGHEALVIPRLRIRAGEKAKAVLHVPPVTIHKQEPFLVRTRQYADGRHVGGVKLVKRHPDWTPQPDRPLYDLRIRSVDGDTGRGLPEAKVQLHNGVGTPPGVHFNLEGEWHTGQEGLLEVSDLLCGERKLLIVSHSSFLPAIYRFRPFPGQTIRRTFVLWHGKRSAYDYRWRKEDTMEALARLGGAEPRDILKLNGWSEATVPEAGQPVKIPCFEAVCHVEARDTPERVARMFEYSGTAELEAANGLKSPLVLIPHQGLRLPGWSFFLARGAEPFRELDRQFGLPAGWARPAQRTLHDDPDRTYPGEAVAIPDARFAHAHPLRK